MTYFEPASEQMDVGFDEVGESNRGPEVLDPLCGAVGDERDGPLVRRFRAPFLL